MPRQIDPESKSHTIMIHARNNHEEKLVEKFKKILNNDGLDINDYFMPIMEKAVTRREPSNPQSILTPDLAHPISLSQAQREKLGIPEDQAVIFDQEIDCQNCGKRHKSQVICWRPGEFQQ